MISDIDANKKVTKFFSSLSDETRLNIILALSEKPRTVTDIHKYVGKDKLTLSAISHQLKQLSDLNIINYKKEGKEKTFELSDKVCWCILRDTFDQFNKKLNINCRKCKTMHKHR